MSEITIVTGFFDIRREKMGLFSRSNDEYIQYFKEWACIKNELIVFCNDEHKNSIINIRKEYGLEHKTRIYTLDDIVELDFKLYKSIEKTMSNNYFKEFMYYRDNPEVVNPLYNYLMCIKPLLVKLAVQKYKLSGTVAWLDFGFNHGLKYYPNKTELDFLWEYDFDSEFIHLFNLEEIPQTPVFEIVRRMESYVQGGTLIADASKWDEFWEIIRLNMLTLNKVGLADDDQILYLMAYNQYPHKFKLNYAYWNEVMKLYGGNHLTYVVKSENPNKLKHVYRKIVRFKRKFKYLIRTFKVLNDGEFDG